MILRRYTSQPLLNQINLLGYTDLQQDKIHIIMDILFRNEFDNLESSDGYTPIPFSFLNKVDVHYDRLLKPLIYNKIIYKKEGKPNNDGNSYKKEITGYSLDTNYIDFYNPLGMRIEIQNEDLIKRVVTSFNRSKQKKQPHITKLKQNIRSLELDQVIKDDLLEWNRKEINAATSISEQRFISEYYTKIQAPVNDILDKEFKISRNPTNNRLDSNFSNVLSIVKNYIKSTEPLVCIDIKNSQPFLIGCLLGMIKYKKNSYRNYIKYFNEAALEAIRNINKDELDTYINETGKGLYYEHLVSKCNLKNRDEAKEINMCVAYSKNTSYADLKFKYEKAFPSILKCLEILKQDNNILGIDRPKEAQAKAASSATKEHSKLAILLQRIESDIVLDTIVKHSKTDILCTIHDSFIIKQSEQEILIEEIRNEFESEFGIYPELGIEILKKDKNKLHQKLDDKLNKLKKKKKI